MTKETIGNFTLYQVWAGEYPLIISQIRTFETIEQKNKRLTKQGFEGSYIMDELHHIFSESDILSRCIPYVQKKQFNMVKE